MEQVYLVCAILGIGVFIVRIVLMLIGMDGGDADIGSVDMDTPDADFHMDAHLDPDLELLSVQSIAGFVMMFGLTGWTMSRTNWAGAILTLIVALALGIFTLWLVSKLFQLVLKLQSSGNVSLQTAGGQEASVYLTIHPGGTGKVSVKVGENLRVVDAVSEDQSEEIKTGERVLVQYTMDGHTLVVRKIVEDQPIS